VVFEAERQESKNDESTISTNASQQEKFDKPKWQTDRQLAFSACSITMSCGSREAVLRLRPR